MHISVPLAERVTGVVSPMIDKLALMWLNRGVPKGNPFSFMTPSGMDWRGLPTLECFCGGQSFYAIVWFDEDRDVAGYVLDGMCSDCGALVTLPTPIDYEVMEMDAND